MEKLYKPYVLLNGKWSYDDYCAICEEHGFKKDAVITTFTDRIGFLVSALQQFPEDDPYQSLVKYSQASMKAQYKIATGKTVEQSMADGSIEIKPCCGGGKVR
jgi:hypothetical protein